MRGQRGVVAVNLVLVLAFALYAVIQLTRTTLAAKQIKDRVKTITGEVVPINSDLNNVPKLDETNRIAADILVAAKPLTGQADQIITAAKSIDNTVSKIQSTAGEINGTVHGINGNLGTLSPIVVSIRDGVAAINRRVDVVLGSVSGIRSDLGNVRSQVNVIDGHANSIDCSMAIQGSACRR